MREALEGRRLSRVQYLVDGKDVSLTDLTGRRVLSVESHGKNLLVHLEGGDSFRIHLLLHGRVRVGPEADPVDGTLRLALHAGGTRVAVVGAPKIELVPTSALERRKAGWGPDATRTDFDAERFLENLAGQGETPVGVALLDQTVVAGVGNMWKCEILHRAKIDPRTPCVQLTDAERRQLGGLVPSFLQSVYERRRAGVRSTVNVYHRADRPCRVCGALVTSFRLGGRTTYACPVCQPAWKEGMRRA